MDRLTRKASKQELIDSKYLFNYVDNSKDPNPARNPIRLSNAYDKLGKLEDSEEEIGCPLDVRLYVVHGTNIYDIEGTEYLVEYVEKEEFTVYAVVYNILYMSFRWSDYKKTWWLKKDKSE